MRSDLLNKYLHPLLLQDEVISTAYLTACYLKDLNFQKKAYIIGAQSISEELKAVGIDSIGFGVSCI